MNSDKEPEDRVNKVKELHRNVRHITQLGMSWFAFLVTANYLTMGLLANNQGTKRSIIFIVALVFISQDLLGIFGLAWVMKAAMAMKIQIDRLDGREESKSESIFRAIKLLRSLEKSRSEIPIELYGLIGLSFMAVLLSLIVAWAGLFVLQIIIKA